jgi:formylglycine-generating enzyme required for sulfatase activity
MSGQSEIVKILFLAANPSGTERRRQDEEIRRIELALERAKRREQFKIIQKGAVTDDDLRRSLLDHEPEIVHFSGQGSGAQGLAFVDSLGHLQVISGDSLARLFELCADHVRCVILNACFSEVQAKVISRHIEIVIGMSEEIGDEASIKFSEGFYDALGVGRSAEQAFEIGRNAIELRSLNEHVVPIILRNPEIRRIRRASVQDDGPRRIVPRGLRSFQTEDSGFFLELLPGPRGNDGLPTSLRFWKTRIEERNPDRTFSVGLIYGPSGCGKSSMVRAGLLPRLSDTILPVFVEATADDTETRLLRGLREAFPGLGNDLNLIDTVITLRRGTQANGRKTLIVIDQFEQWLHAKREAERSNLALALRLCDGSHIQCIVMIRDDFWVSNKRFMDDVGVRISDGENAALVDLFDVRHGRKVLGLFADAYGVWENSSVEPIERAQFLDDAVSGLAQDDRVICVRIALFCELFQGKPWDLKTLEKAGGVEGVGVLFMEETFSADHAPAENRYHQKAVRSVLNALLPEPGSKIKGRMRSDRDLMDVSGYAHRPDDFQALVRILDEKTHLITPTDHEGLGTDEGAAKEPSVGRFYQLTHDYLVPSIREWLTRKQRETRRGRAELQLADRSAIWAAKPENRQLPSLWEWANIRLLTKKNDWTEPQRKMMRLAGRVHGIRTGFGLLLVTLLTLGGMDAYGRVKTSDLVDALKIASIEDVPALVKQLEGYRHWAAPRLKQALDESEVNSPSHLRASLGLLPADAKQVDYLYDRLLAASATELPVLRDALSAHRSQLSPRLWSLLEGAKPGYSGLLSTASALAAYDPDGPGWDSLSGKVAQRLLTESSVYLGTWLKALRPVRGKLTTALVPIFRDTKRPALEHQQATDILADYASEDPELLANLLMDADPASFAIMFPVAQRLAETTSPILHAEIAKKLEPAWEDSPLDPSWAKPDPSLTRLVEDANGLIAERFAFCQTMPLDQFLIHAEDLRKSGYRPTRFRPYSDGSLVRVAAVWTRDGRNGRIVSGLTPEQFRLQDAKNRSENYLPVDVAGYMAHIDDGKPANRYAAIWAEQQPGTQAEAEVEVAATEVEHQAAQSRHRGAGLIPLTTQVAQAADKQSRYCSVWRKAGAQEAPPYRENLCEANVSAEAARHDSTLIDVSVGAAGPPVSAKERASAALKAAADAIKARPDDQSVRFSRAVSNYQLGNDQDAIADLNLLIEKAPAGGLGVQYRAMAHARLRHAKEASEDLAIFDKLPVLTSSKLLLAVVVAAELGEGLDETLGKLESALKKQPRDSILPNDAIAAYSMAAQALSRTDPAKSQRLAERALDLVRSAIQNGVSQYDPVQANSFLDAIRGLPRFAEIMHLDRRYFAVWGSDANLEGVPLCGMNPDAHLRKCQELIDKGYRPVSLSVSRTLTEGPLVTASVWHRPMVKEAAKDELSKRQARAAVTLLRMGRAEEVWPLLRHSSDPRLRSFIFNWLKPLGADLKLVTAELGRIGPDGMPASGQAQQKMDAILFHPQTSLRRELILALGTYGTEGLSSDEGQALIAKLLDFYRNDPDAGIHGAAEWTLRTWGQQAKISATDADLMKLKDWGQRRWFVNGQGQTLAVIDGPVDFLMGSPSNEPDRDGSDREFQHHKRINRRFAIATKELAYGQYQRAFRQTPDNASPPPLMSGDPRQTSPMTGLDWYGAAAYCNWLSEREQLEPCYERNPNGFYAAGMKAVADFLDRSGYRLPTEAEWEYACRAGAVTSRYYGESKELLGKYAWFADNSSAVTSPCGLLLPNDLGIFDMLGNAAEWCQDEYWIYVSGDDKSGLFDVKSPLIIHNDTAHIMRGNSSLAKAKSVRSSVRYVLQPSFRDLGIGFRLARTLK